MVTGLSYGKRGGGVHEKDRALSVKRGYGEIALFDLAGGENREELS